MFRTRTMAALLSFALVACITPGRVPRQLAGSQEMITQDDIADSRGTTAYEVIKSLRGNYLSHRGPTSLSGTSSPYPTVYVDGMRYGGIDALRTIPAAQISTIRLYRAWDAMTRYGDGNMGGVIAITTRLGP